MKHQSEFIKNSITLIKGVGFSQIIIFSVTPILTRLYSPEEFGVFLVYLAVIGVLQMISTGRYEQAIILPQKKSHAANVVLLTLILIILFCLVLFLTVLFFRESISGFLFKSSLYEQTILLIPFGVLFYGINQSLLQWLLREKKINEISFFRVFRASSLSSGQLLFSRFSLQYIGLIYGFIIGELLSFFYLLRKCRTDIKNIIIFFDLKLIFKMMYRYNEFPKFDLLASVFNQASHQLPIIFLGVFIGPDVAGIYGLTQRVIAAPVSIISSVVVDSFKKIAVDSYNKTNSCRNEYWLVLRMLLKFAVLPFIVILYWGEELFTFFFGSEWGLSGQYAEIMIILFLFRFIASPLSSILYIAEKQKYNLWGNSALFVSVLIFGVYVFLSHDVISALILYTILNSLIYLWYIVYSYQVSKRI